MPTDEDIFGWVDEARDRIFAAAEARNSSPRQFAATLVCVISTDEETIAAHIGDGAAVYKMEGEWKILSWPAQGEYASTTFFITDDLSPQLRINRIQGRVEAFALFSDGIERLVLDFSTQLPSHNFFERFCGTVKSAGQTGTTQLLTDGLRRFLDSPPINERTDDDKSLIIAVRV